MSRLNTWCCLMGSFGSALAFPGSVVSMRQAGLQSTPFDPVQQYVSNQGAHAWVAPLPTDSRSPCPALNVMANHGYIPHNGHATLAQIEEALPTVFGVGPDVATFLSFIGVFFNGNIVGFNIGGWNKMFTGFSAGQFQGLYDMGTLEGPDIMKTICDRYAAGHYAGDGDPNDPIASGHLGPLVDELIFRNIANKTATETEGILSPSVTLPFLTMTPNGDGTFTKTPYHESIPDNWYKRNVVDPYDLELLGADIVEIALRGGFNNMPASDQIFSGLDVSSLTGGAYSNADMADGLTRMCFFTQAAEFILPAAATKAGASTAKSADVSSIAAKFAKATEAMPCAGHKLQKLDLNVLKKAFDWL